jgi:hypothetical protein
MEDYRIPKKILGGNFGGKRPAAISRSRWEENVQNDSLPAPYTTLEACGTKYTELEEDNWGGHDPNTGRSVIGERQSHT